MCVWWVWCVCDVNGVYGVCVCEQNMTPLDELESALLVLPEQRLPQHLQVFMSYFICTILYIISSCVCCIFVLPTDIATVEDFWSNC